MGLYSLSVYQIKITLLESKPAIWRRLLIPASITFEHLHLILQAAMGWEDAHLYEFKFKDVTVTIPDDPEDWPEPELYAEQLQADEFLIDEFLCAEKQCTYVYDFGDNWQISLKLEATLEADPQQQYPYCTGGARNGPPENSGGMHGYSHLLHFLADPWGPEEGEPPFWIQNGRNDPLEPAFFDRPAINNKLAELAAAVLPENILPPTRDQWQQLFSLARQIKKINPWHALPEDACIAVTPPGAQEAIYYLTLSPDENTRGFAALPGNEAYHTLRRLVQQRPKVDDLIFLAQQNCLICSYGKKEDLLPEEKQLLNDLGLHFRGQGNWIYFRSFVPGYIPWWLSRQEAELLLSTLPQYLMVLADLADGSFSFHLDQRPMITRKQDPTSAGGWSSHQVKAPAPLPAPKPYIIQNEIFIARLRKKKKSPIQLEVDLVYLPFPSHPSATSRPFLPRTLLLLPHDGGTIFDQELLTPKDDLTALLLEKIEKQILTYGRPQAIYARQEEVISLLQDLCHKLNIPLRLNEEMPAADEAIADLLDYMSAQE